MKFEKLLQIGIVTDNVEASVAQFKNFGFENWTEMPFESRFIPGMTLNGEPSDLRFNGAMYSDGNLEIELIEPVSESVFMDWLREHGPGIHHLALKPVGDFDDFMAEYKAMGYEPLIEVLDGTKTRGFTYLDTFKSLGFFTEIHKGAPGNPDECKQEEQA